MDWNVVVERNRQALTRVLAGLYAMAGLQQPTAGARQSEPDALSANADCRVPAAATLPRHLHRAVLRLLRAAEAAARRLVIVAARGIVVPPQVSRPRKPKPGSAFLRNRHGTGIILPRGIHLPGSPARTAPSALCLPLLDPPRRRGRPRRPAPGAVPRISVPGCTVPFPVSPYRPPAPGDRIDARRLMLRLHALGRALDDLEGQALRFARWRSRLAAELQKRRECLLPGENRVSRNPRGAAIPVRFRRVWPLRTGRPPGSRRRSPHEVHAILSDLHGLAFDVLERRDTS